MENEERLPKVIRLGMIAPKIMAVIAGHAVGLVIAVNTVEPLRALLQGWGWL